MYASSSWSSCFTSMAIADASASKLPSWIYAVMADTILPFSSVISYRSSVSSFFMGSSCFSLSAESSVCSKSSVCSWSSCDFSCVWSPVSLFSFSCSIRFWVCTIPPAVSDDFSSPSAIADMLLLSSRTIESTSASILFDLFLFMALPSCFCFSILFHCLFQQAHQFQGTPEMLFLLLLRPQNTSLPCRVLALLYPYYKGFFFFPRHSFAPSHIQS